MDNTNGTYTITYYSYGKNAHETNSDSCKLFYKNIELIGPIDANNTQITNY